MTTKDLTKVEKRFAKNWYEGEHLKYDPKNLNIKFIREMMKKTAHHEAGYFVTKLLFTLFRPGVTFSLCS